MPRYLTWMRAGYQAVGLRLVLHRCFDLGCATFPKELLFGTPRSRHFSLKGRADLRVALLYRLFAFGCVQKARAADTNQAWCHYSTDSVRMLYRDPYIVASTNSTFLEAVQVPPPLQRVKGSALP